jgi:DNA-binding transcriptional LysR family regulator
MGMDLRQLRYLVATVDAGSATQAASVLHVTQPVLSRQLRQLEHRLGMSLFDRRGGRLVLTRAGEQFTAMARELLNGADRVERAAADLADGRIGEIHLAVPTTTLTDVLAPFIASLDATDPIPIVRELDPPGALGALRSGADFAIVTRPPARSLASRLLAVLPVWAYTRPGDRWPAHGEVRVEELVTRPLVLMTKDFRPRTLLDTAVESAGLSYGSVLECTNAQVAQALAAAGRGTAVVSDDPRFELAPARILGPTGHVNIRLYAAWDMRHHASSALATFADRIADFCVRLYGPDVSA